MRNRYGHLVPILTYLGALFRIFGLLILVPLLVLALYKGGSRPEVSSLCFMAPAALALLLGVLLK